METGGVRLTASEGAQQVLNGNLDDALRWQGNGGWRAHSQI